MLKPHHEVGCRRLQVGVVVDTLIGGHGHGRVNLEVVRHVAAQGHKVFVLAGEVDESVLKLQGVVWERVRRPQRYGAMIANRFFDAGCRRWLGENRSRLDILMVTGTATSFPADVRSFHFVHQQWLHSPFHPYKQKLNFRSIYHRINTHVNVVQERRALKSMRHAVAVSNRVRDELLAFGVPRNKVEVIPNGVDLDDFKPGSADRLRLKLPWGVLLALFVGDTMTDRKNLSTVLRAIKHLPGVHLAIAGKMEGSPFPSLRDELGLKDRVHFLGYRRDVPDLMRAADVVVFPSAYEPFGLVVLEALATGTPVVTAIGVGSAPIAAEAGMPIVERCTDDRELADAIQTSLHLGANSSTAARARRVAERFSWSSMAAQYLDLFQRLKK